MEQDDFYKVLDIPSNADDKQIKEAYRRMAFRYHPDRNKENPDTAEKMKGVNEAYAVLSNPTKRREYDALRQQFGSSAYRQFRKSYSEQDIFSGSDINSILEEMARSFGFRGFDEVFREFYGQGYRTFEFKNSGFSASGFVFTGPFRKQRQNHHSPWPSQGILGKLSRYAIKKISGVDLPKNGSNHYDVICLTPEQAIHGGPYAYFHRKKSKRLVVKIPSGVQEGQHIRLAGMGEEGKGGGESGNLYLRVKIKKPLIRKIKDIITDFRAN